MLEYLQIHDLHFNELAKEWWAVVFLAAPYKQYCIFYIKLFCAKYLSFLIVLHIVGSCNRKVNFITLFANLSNYRSRHTKHI